MRPIRVAVMTCAGILIAQAGIWGCSDDSTATKPNATAETRTTVIGPEGGTVTGDGVTLDIPPGALASPVAISVAATGSAPGGFTALSRLYTFGPDGTAFLKPIGVTFAIAPSAKKPIVYWSKMGGGYEPVGGTAQGGTISARVTHFSTGFAAEAPTDTDAGTTDAGLDDAATDDAGDAGAGDAGGDDGGSAPKIIDVNTVNSAGVPANVTWAAWQDGAGVWTQLLPKTTGVYEFTPTGARYGVVLVCSDGATDIQGQLYYRTTATTRIDMTAGAGCAPAASPSTYTFGGTMTNLPGAATYRVSGTGTGFGYGALNINGSSASYSVGTFRVGSMEDIAVGVSDGAGAPTPNILKMLLVRGQAFNGNVVRDIDWSTEGFVPDATYTATVTNAINAGAKIYVSYATANAPSHGMPLMKGAANLASGTLTQEFSSIPAGEALATDNYMLYAYDGAGIASVRRFFHDAANVTTAMPSPPAATFGIAATTPYIQPRYTFPEATSVQSYSARWDHFVGKFDRRAYNIDIDPAWLSGTAPFVYDFPDLSGVTGWQTAWGVPSNVAAGAVTTGFAATTKTTFTGGYEIQTAEARGSVP